MDYLRALAREVRSEAVQTALAEVLSYLEEFFTRFSEAVALSWVALKGWGRVLWLLGVALVSAATRVLLPFFSALLRAFWRHQRRQPWPVLFGEAATVLVLVLLYTLQRFVRRRRYIFRAQAYVKSKVHAVRNRYERFVLDLKKINAGVAAAFPHVVVAFVMLNSWYLLPKTIADLADSGALTFLTLTLPGLFMCTALVDKNPAQLGVWYRFWAVSAMLQSVEDVLRLVPFVGAAVFGRFPFLQTLKFFLYIYLLLPLGGTEVLYRRVAMPLVSKYVGKVQLTPQTREKSRNWLQMFDFFAGRFLGTPGRILRNVLKELVTTLNEAPLMLMPLPTIFMPGLFTKCGIVYMARCYPAYTTMQNPLTTAAFVEGRSKTAKNKKSDDSDEIWENDLRSAHYWVIVALVFFIKEAGVDDVLAWIPFSTTFQLLFFFWLQMPGLRGADYLFSKLVLMLSNLLEAHAKQAGDRSQTGAEAKGTERVVENGETQRSARESAEDDQLKSVDGQESDTGKEASDGDAATSEDKGTASDDCGLRRRKQSVRK